MFHRVGFAVVFLHERYIPCQQFEKLFWASVSLMSVRQDDMSPSGNTFQVVTSDIRLDLWIYTFQPSNSSK